MRRGFTLLEVMVALAIALPALLVLYREGATALQVARSSITIQNGLSRAQSHLAALTVAGVVAGDREGDDGAGYRWHTRVMPIATAAQTSLYAASVRISWKSWRGEQSVLLETRLIGPATGEAP